MVLFPVIVHCVPLAVGSRLVETAASGIIGKRWAGYLIQGRRLTEFREEEGQIMMIKRGYRILGKWELVGTRVRIVKLT